MNKEFGEKKRNYLLTAKKIWEQIDRLYTNETSILDRSRSLKKHLHIQTQKKLEQKNLKVEWKVDQEESWFSAYRDERGW